MFDVNHITIVDILSAGARGYLRCLLANDIGKLFNGQQAVSRKALLTQISANAGLVTFILSVVLMTCQIMGLILC